MENLLLEMHRKMDDLKSERITAQGEAKIASIRCSELEAEIKFVKQETSQQAKLYDNLIEAQEKKLAEKQTEVWKLNLLIDGLQRKQIEQTMELERNRKARELDSLVVDLP